MKSSDSNLPKILIALKNILFPELCFGCNAHLYRGEQVLCAFCRDELPLTEFNFEQENAVDRIFYGRAPVCKASALFYYRESGLIKRLIHRLKYQGMQQLGGFMGEWHGEILKKDPGISNIDLVMPVPLHAAKMRKRGYNQCELFGRAIASSLQAEYTGKLLKKIKNARTQTTRNRWLRWKNTQGVFHLAHPERLEGKKILLVDDVITTGATLEACCLALSSVARLEIYIAVMAVVP
ncbi:ComF family protein [Robiginitalea sp. IMCC43444]|uniref:ComF family protein n=1 Tax=Robiginitalea sp. IMCC43444 TaxID=3459121 RepID=UPI0040418F5D